MRPARHYDRWKMLSVWLPRIGDAISAHVSAENLAPILFRIHFGPPLSPDDVAAELPNQNEIAGSIAVDVDRDRRSVDVHVGRAFEHGLANPENVSESMLVRRMVEGALVLLDGQADADTVVGLHRVVVPDADVRHLHHFRVRRFRDFIHDSVPPAPVVVDPVDEATDRLDLGWRFRPRDQGADIQGKKDCTAFLGDVVRGIEDDLCSGLKVFDRRQLVLLALVNHETAMVNQRRWRTTARASLAFRKDRTAGLRTILDKEFENNGALVASRILVELAICECPTSGGAVPGKVDLARLMSKLLMAMHYGGWSDAIFFDAMEPSLRITPLGDIHGDVRFLTDVTEPFGRLSGEVILDGAIDRYSRNFDAPEDAPPVKDTLDPRFLAAWEAEKGLPLDDLRHLADLLEDAGIARESSGVLNEVVGTGKATPGGTAAVGEDRRVVGPPATTIIAPRSPRDFWKKTSGPGGFDGVFPCSGDRSCNLRRARTPNSSLCQDLSGCHRVYGGRLL